MTSQRCQSTAHSAAAPSLPRTKAMAMATLPLLLLLLLLAAGGVAAAPFLPAHTVACAPSSAALGLTSTFTAAFPTATAASDIVVAAGQALLFDPPGPITLASLTVETGAKLVFNWNTNINLTVGDIALRGELTIGTEACPFENQVLITLTGTRTVTATRGDFGSRFLGVDQGGTLELHGSKGLGLAGGVSWTRLSATLSPGGTTMALADNVASSSAITRYANWAVGDQLIIASTDYNPTQAERVTITAVTGSSVTFTPAVTWKHFGQATVGVDERAEVGLLTRNIRIQGLDEGAASVNGGHLIVFSQFAAVHIEGVEFYNMGQDLIGRYPVHFHMSGRVPQGTYVRDLSIQRSNFRCISVHATQDLLVQDLVSYDVFGHCYYLEDGVETGNRFVHNLAVLVKPKTFGQRLGSDSASAVSGFWITNPNNTFTDNAIAGCWGTGYWIHVRSGPRGTSASVSSYSTVKPNLAPLKLFRGNYVHSADSGIQVESQDFDKDDTPASPAGAGTAGYSPRNPDNSFAETVIDGMVAHHLQQSGVWTRGVLFRVKNSFFADNYESIQFATSGSHPDPGTSWLEDTLIVGFSDNTGSNDNTQDTFRSRRFQNWDTTFQTSVPREVGGDRNMNGWRMYDGPQFANRVTFRRFNKDVYSLPHSPLGMRSNNKNQCATTVSVAGLAFENVTRRVYFVDSNSPTANNDGGRTINFRDTDGSVSGNSNAVVLPNLPVYNAPTCVATSSFGLSCPHKYAQLWVLDMANSAEDNSLIISRNNRPAGTTPQSAAQTIYGFSSAGMLRQQPIVSIGASYLLRFSSRMPTSLALQLNNALKNEWVNLAVCYPPGSTISRVARGYANFPGNSKPSLTDAKAAVSDLTLATSRTGTSAGDAYFWDSARGILFITLRQRNDRQEYNAMTDFCPPQGCDFVWINAVSSGGALDCTTAAFSGDSIQETAGAWLAQSFAASGSSAPAPAPSSSAVAPAASSSPAVPVASSSPAPAPAASSSPAVPVASSSPAPAPAPSSSAAVPLASSSPAPAPAPSSSPARSSSAAAPAASPSALPGWNLVWSDEFSGTAIDRTKWDFEVNCWGGGNAEKQCYVDSADNAWVANGQLNLQAKRIPGGYKGSATGCTNNNENSCTWTQPATSARLRTLNSVSGSWLYGRFEMRAQMPKGDFLWPAFWMLPTDNVYGTWAASGEIDIIEARGQRPSAMEHTVHYGAPWPNNRYTGSGPITYPEVDFTSSFHVFALEWERDEIRWYVDGALKHSQTLLRWFNTSGVTPNPYTDIRQPFDQRFHMILNVAVAGGFFPSSTYGTFDPDAASPTWLSPMMIDYVRVYSRNASAPSVVAAATTTSSATPAAPVSSNTPAPPVSSATPPVASPSATPAVSCPTNQPHPYTATGSALYLVGTNTLSLSSGSGAVDATVSSAGGVNRDGTPTNALTYDITGLSGEVNAGQAASFALYVDAGTVVGTGIQIRISFDFTNDGVFDRVEQAAYFALNPTVGYETYSRTLTLVSGSNYAALVNGRVRVQIWAAIGNGPISVRTGARPEQCQVSFVAIPYTLSTGAAPSSSAPVVAPSSSPASSSKPASSASSRASSSPASSSKPASAAPSSSSSSSLRASSSAQASSSKPPSSSSSSSSSSSTAGANALGESSSSSTAMVAGIAGGIVGVLAVVVVVSALIVVRRRAVSNRMIKVGSSESVYQTTPETERRVVKNPAYLKKRESMA